MFGKSKKKAAPPPPKSSHQAKVFSGLVAGVIAGIAATWVLDKFQQGAITATRRAEGAANAGNALSRQQERQIEDQRRAHAETAVQLARSTGRKLSRAQQQKAVPIVHYAAGALAGAVYGVAAELVPVVRRGYGTGYANIVFLGGSEALAPWLGLGPRQGIQLTPAGLPAPLVFGATLETTRRFLRWML